MTSDWGAVLLLAFALAGSGCASSPAKGEVGAPPKAGGEPVPPQAAPSAETLPELPTGEPVSFDRELELVQRVRALDARQSVRGLRISESALKKHLETSFERELPERALVGTAAMLRLLGVVPEEFDYERTMLRLLEQQLAGLYDPKLDAMYVRDHLDGAELEATLLHELVHALQDQTYHLDDFSTWREDGSDRTSALSSLAEGDAMSAMFDALLLLASERTGTPARTALDVSDAELLLGLDAAADAAGDDGVPPIVQRSLIAPYRDGLVFVHALRRKGGWAALDAVWKNPPISTEQVLHVERYLRREAPIDVAITEPPGNGWKLLLSDVWGEQSVRLLLEEWLPKKDAALAASGWGGDRIAVFELAGTEGPAEHASGGEKSRGEKPPRILTWHLVSDDEASAKRTFAALSRTKSASPVTCEERGSLGPIAVGRRGRHILLVAGPEHASCKGVSPWILKEFERIGRN